MVSNLRFLAVLLLSALVGCTTATVPEPETTAPSAEETLSGEQQALQQEGKVSVGTLSRAQQAYFLENSKYAASIEDLDVALAPQAYDLKIVEVDAQHMIAKATPTEAGLKSYITGVSGIAQRVVCASNAPGEEIASPVFQDEAWACGPNSTQVE